MDDKDKADAGPGASVMAMLLLPGPKPITAPELIAAVARLFPDLAGKVTDAGAGRPDGGDALLLTVAGRLLTVFGVDAPIPAPDMARACRMSLSWPEAEAAVAGHQAHLVIAPLGKGTRPLADAISVTVLALAAAGLAGPVALWWPSAGLLAPPDRLTAAAAALNQDRLPIELWVNLLPLSDPKAGRVLATEGLEEGFGLMEIEAPIGGPRPEQAAGRVIGLVEYLLTHGPVLKDGDTIGVSQTEKIGIRHLPSLRDPARQVHRLDFSGTEFAA